MKPACLPEQLLCRAVGVLPEARERAPLLFAERPMRAAFERAFVISGFGEHRAHRRDMGLAAGVRGAGKRDLVVAEAEAIGGAAFDERQGLQGLDGGARINRPLGVAERQNHPAVGIDDRARAAMGGFDPIAARGLDGHRIRHGFLSAPPVMPAKAGIHKVSLRL